MAKQRAGRKKRTHAGVKVLALKDGRYVCRWRDPVTGKSVQQSFDKLRLSSDEARRKWAVAKSEALAETRRAIALGAVDAVRVTIADARTQYLAAITHKATRSSKDAPLRTFVEQMQKVGVVSMLELTGPKLVRGWRDWVASPRLDYAPGTRNHWLTVVATFLRWARRRGMLPRVTEEATLDASERVPQPPKEIEFLQPDQVRQLLVAAINHDKLDRENRRVAPLVVALVLSGCRLNEVLGLRWGEVEADGLRLTAERVKTRRGRLVTFAEAPTLRALLDRLRPPEPSPDALVFGDWDTAGWENARIRLRRYYRAPAGWSAQTLRRTTSCILTNSTIFAGASAWHAAKRAGHSVAQAEADYAGRMTSLVPGATCIEDAAGIRKECEAIVAAAGAEAVTS